MKTYMGRFFKNNKKPTHIYIYISFFIAARVYIDAVYFYAIDRDVTIINICIRYDCETRSYILLLLLLLLCKLPWRVYGRGG